MVLPLLESVRAVTGVDDLIIDGDISYSIILGAASSSDSKYNGTDLTDLPAVNEDFEEPDFFIEPIARLITTEADGPGKTATFQVRLTVQPNAKPGSATLARYFMVGVRLNESRGESTRSDDEPRCAWMR